MKIIGFQLWSPLSILTGISLPHTHFAKFAFSKAQKSQVKLTFEQGQSYTPEEIQQMAFADPDCIAPLSTENKEMLEINKEEPCSVCTTWEQEIKETVAAIKETKRFENIPLTREVFHIHTNEAIMQPFRTVNMENLVEAQSKDNFCTRTMRELLTTPEAERKNKRYFILNGTLLARKINKNDPDIPEQSTHLYQIVVPRPLLTELVARIHLIGHPGSNKMVKMLKSYYHHEDLIKVCNAIAGGCNLCQCYKNFGNRELPQGMLRPASYPCEIVYVDVMHMEPVTHLNKRYIYILTMVDEFSMYTWAFPMTNQLHETIIQCFESMIPHTPVKELVSDNAKNLLANPKVEDYLKKFGIASRLTLPYHAQSNGKNECVNKLIRMATTITVKSLGGNWASNLSYVVRAFNSIPHNYPRLANVTPFELVHGRKPYVEDPLSYIEQLNPLQYQKSIQIFKTLIETVTKERYEAILVEVKRRMAQSKIQLGTFVYLIDFDRKKGKPFIVLDKVYEVIKRDNYGLWISNVHDPNEVIRTHIKNVRLIRDRPKDIFDELSPSLLKILGEPNPVSQRTIRKWHKNKSSQQSLQQLQQERDLLEKEIDKSLPEIELGDEEENIGEATFSIQGEDPLPLSPGSDSHPALELVEESTSGSSTKLSSESDSVSHQENQGARKKIFPSSHKSDHETLIPTSSGSFFDLETQKHISVSQRNQPISTSQSKAPNPTLVRREQETNLSEIPKDIQTRFTLTTTEATQTEPKESLYDKIKRALKTKGRRLQNGQLMFSQPHCMVELFGAFTRFTVTGPRH